MYVDPVTTPRRYSRDGVDVLARIAYVSPFDDEPIGVHLHVVHLDSMEHWEAVVTTEGYKLPPGLSPVALEILQKLADFLSVLLMSGALNEAEQCATEIMQYRLLNSPDSPIGLFLDTQLKAIESWTKLLSNKN